MPSRAELYDGCPAALPVAAALTLLCVRWLPVRFEYVPNDYGIVSLATLGRYPMQQEIFWYVFALAAGTVLTWLLARGFRRAGLGVAAPLLLQSMVIFKQPRIGGAVVCHQDASFLTTEPSSVLGLWFALEDATVENGCLWALPGQHWSPLRSRFRRDGRGLGTEWYDRRPWPEAGRVPIEAKHGTLVVLHGHLPHLSGPNRSARSRRRLRRASPRRRRRRRRSGRRRSRGHAP